MKITVERINETTKEDSTSKRVIKVLLLLGIPVTLILLVVTILTMNLMFAFVGLGLSLVGAIGSYYMWNK